MADVQLSALARADLVDLLLAIELQNPSAAKRLEGRLRDKFSLLADFPFVGSSRHDLGENARILTEGNYVILHEADEAVVTVLRIVHGARDLTSL